MRYRYQCDRDVILTIAVPRSDGRLPTVGPRRRMHLPARPVYLYNLATYIIVQFTPLRDNRTAPFSLAASAVCFILSPPL